MEDYTFERLWKELNDGYQIYYTYMDRRYVLTKLSKNCYSRELVNHNGKGPHPRSQIVTLKAVKELFDFMEDIEYKVNL
mgnify:CR=1 FL=1